VSDELVCNTETKYIYGNKLKLTSGAWQDYMFAKGIDHIKTPPDAHAQNGRVERVHFTILSGFRTVLTPFATHRALYAEGLPVLPSIFRV